MPQTGSGAIGLFGVAVAMVSEDADDVRRRRLRFRVWHRGLREVDLILGRFADARLAAMSSSHLDAFEALLQVPDQDVLAWVMGEVPVPFDQDTPLLREVIAFHGGGA